jgi:hypothetical protein
MVRRWQEPQSMLLREQYELSIQAVAGRSAIYENRELI